MTGSATWKKAVLFASECKVNPPKAAMQAAFLLMPHLAAFCRFMPPCAGLCRTVPFYTRRKERRRKDGKRKASSTKPLSVR
jgi:hypothetical protein